MFAEPNNTPFDLHFSLFGIHVRVHPFFWLASLLMSGSTDPRMALLWIIVVFVSILVHEFGHALVARAFGNDPWVVLYGFGGLAIYQPRGETRWQRVLISAAGPGAGFLLAAGVLGVLWVSNRAVPIIELWEGEPILHATLAQFVLYMLFVNIFWGLLNLLPIFPLDGGQIARQIFESFDSHRGIRWTLWLSLFTAALVAAVSLAGRSFYTTVFFGFLAYNNFVMLQHVSGRFGGWR